MDKNRILWIEMFGGERRKIDSYFIFGLRDLKGKGGGIVQALYEYRVNLTLAPALCN